MKSKPNKTSKVAPIPLPEFGVAPNPNPGSSGPFSLHLDQSDVRKLIDGLLRYALRKQEIPDVELLHALDTVAVKFSARKHADLLFLAEVKPAVTAVAPSKKKKRAARRSASRKKLKNQRNPEGQ